MQYWRRNVSIGRAMIVIAVFALALTVAPAGHRYLALLPWLAGLPALFLRGRSEFLVVMGIVAVLGLELGLAVVSSHCPALPRPGY